MDQAIIDYLLQNHNDMNERMAGIRREDYANEAEYQAALQAIQIEYA
jgi:hypothetical protein